MHKAIIATFGAVLLMGSTAVSGAAPLSPAMGANANIDRGITNIQFRGHHHRHGWHGHRHHRHGWHGHRHHRHGWHHRHHGWGPAVGGLAAGAIIGGAIAAGQANAAQQNHAYCSQRFRSYDPRSGTYLGYDGQRHPCP